jgi:predicted peptidase
MKLLAILLALVAPQAAQKNVDGFAARIHRTMPYRLFIPKAYDKNQKYPLVLWLHGAGSVGRDNIKQISGASLRGTHTWTGSQIQAKYSPFVLAPQTNRSWIADDELVLELLESIKTEFSVDPARIYIAGQSMGGYGTWHLISERPALFAAAIPLCGGGDTSRAATLVNIPIWAFHGDADDSVPVAESRKMVAAIKGAGGNPRYTEYKGVGHEVWFKTFQERGLAEWLFAQHK